MSAAILVIACVVAFCIVIPGLKGIKNAGIAVPYFAIPVAVSAALLGWSFADGRITTILLFLAVFVVVTRACCWLVKFY